MLNNKGKIVRETKLPTDPETIARCIAAAGLAIERIGLEPVVLQPSCLACCSAMAGP